MSLAAKNKWRRHGKVALFKVINAVTQRSGENRASFRDGQVAELSTVLDQFRHAVRKGRNASSSLHKRLVSAWGNPAWSVREEYMSAMFSVVRRSQGPVLECGSGLSTLLLGVLGADQGRIVHTLEHQEHWAGHLDQALRLTGVHNVRVHHVPLVEHRGFHWYRVREKVLPDRFGAVICDGPPAMTPGGRYGLLPVMRERLAPGCIILLDDAARATERRILARWSRTLGSDVRLSGTLKPYAELQVPAASAVVAEPTTATG